MKELSMFRITEIEEKMRNFHDCLMHYIDENNINLTTDDELRINNCFNDKGIVTNDFKNFVFRPGDKHQLLQVAKFIKDKIKRKCGEQNSILSEGDDYLFFKCCNPNARLPTISTIIGNFHGKEVYSAENMRNALSKGMRPDPIIMFE